MLFLLRFIDLIYCEFFNDNFFFKFQLNSPFPLAFARTVSMSGFHLTHIWQHQIITYTKEQSHLEVYLKIQKFIAMITYTLSKFFIKIPKQFFANCKFTKLNNCKIFSFISVKKNLFLSTYQKIHMKSSYVLPLSTPF